MESWLNDIYVQKRKKGRREHWTSHGEDESGDDVILIPATQQIDTVVGKVLRDDDVEGLQSQNTKKYYCLKISTD